MIAEGHPNHAQLPPHIHPLTNDLTQRDLLLLSLFCKGKAQITWWAKNICDML